MVMVEGTLGPSLACRFLGSPVSLALQIFGTFLHFLAAAGWFNSGLGRVQELRRRLKSERLKGSSEPLHGKEGGCLPGVSVIMPVKGCRQHSVSNWRSQIGMSYDGEVEFNFVVESESDPAYSAIQQMIQSEAARRVRVHVAGISSTCSQKIHNQLKGIEESNSFSKYALFLDDDVQLHETSLRDLVMAMENNPSIYISTGYPFDIVGHDGTFFSHCMAAYHHILGIGAFATERHMFIWGGCMLLRMRSLKEDQYGVVSSWRHGGYSDDLILVTTCEEHKLINSCPFFSCYPQRLPPATFVNCWNYLRRQLFVMDTYRNTYGKVTNRILLSLLCLLGIGLPFPVISGLVQLLVWQSGESCPSTAALFSPQSILRVWLLAWVVASLSWSWMLGKTQDMFHTLSVSKSSAAIMRMKAWSWAQFWLGIYCNWMLLVVVAAVTLVKSDIVWSGVRYVKSGGKVAIHSRI